MGPILNSICDTVTNVTSLSMSGKPTLNVSYIDQWQTTFVNISGLKGKQLNLLVTDLSGRTIFSEKGIINNGYFTKDLVMNGFASGMYLITVYTEKEKLKGKIVKP